MDAISQTTHSNSSSWMKILEFRLEISLKFLSKGTINIPPLVQIMVWRQPGHKPLSEPMMAKITNIYASLGLNELMWMY